MRIYDVDRGEGFGEVGRWRFGGDQGVAASLDCDGCRSPIRREFRDTSAYYRIARHPDPVYDSLNRNDEPSELTGSRSAATGESNHAGASGARGFSRCPDGYKQTKQAP